MDCAKLRMLGVTSPTWTVASWRISACLAARSDSQCTLTLLISPPHSFTSSSSLPARHTQKARNVGVRREATVGHNRLSGNKRRLVRSQKEDGAGDLFWLAHATYRM